MNKDNPVPSLDKLKEEIEYRGFTPRSTSKKLYYNKICMTEKQIIQLFKDLQNGVENSKEQPDNICDMCDKPYSCYMCSSIG